MNKETSSFSFRKNCILAMIEITSSPKSTKTVSNSGWEKKLTESIRSNVAYKKLNDKLGILISLIATSKFLTLLGFTAIRVKIR